MDCSLSIVDQVKYQTVKHQSHGLPSSAWFVPQETCSTLKVGCTQSFLHLQLKQEEYNIRYCFLGAEVSGPRNIECVFLKFELKQLQQMEIFLPYYLQSHKYKKEQGFL